MSLIQKLILFTLREYCVLSGKCLTVPLYRVREIMILRLFSQFSLNTSWVLIVLFISDYLLGDKKKIISDIPTCFVVFRFSHDLWW